MKRVGSVSLAARIASSSSFAPASSDAVSTDAARLAALPRRNAEPNAWSPPSPSEPERSRSVSRHSRLRRRWPAGTAAAASTSGGNHCERDENGSAATNVSPEAAVGDPPATAAAPALRAGVEADADEDENEGAAGPTRPPSAHDARGRRAAAAATAASEGPSQAALARLGPWTNASEEAAAAGGGRGSMTPILSASAVGARGWAVKTAAAAANLAPRANEPRCCRR